MKGSQRVRTRTSFLTCFVGELADADAIGQTHPFSFFLICCVRCCPATLLRGRRSTDPSYLVGSKRKRRGTVSCSRAATAPLGRDLPPDVIPCVVCLREFYFAFMPLLSCLCFHAITISRLESAGQPSRVLARGGAWRRAKYGYVSVLSFHHIAILHLAHFQASFSE